VIGIARDGSLPSPAVMLSPTIWRRRSGFGSAEPNVSSVENEWHEWLYGVGSHDWCGQSGSGAYHTTTVCSCALLNALRTREVDGSGLLLLLLLLVNQGVVARARALVVRPASHRRQLIIRRIARPPS
jgi:hypothetical protein